jgi:cytochrome c oxidase assembly protein subunit 15
VLAAGALGTLFVSMLLGRDLVVYTATVQRLNFGLYVLTVGLVAVGCWRLFTAETAADIRTLRREHSE